MISHQLQLRTGDRREVDRAGQLSVFGVVAALVKTTHTLESFDECGGVGRDRPLDTQETDTSTGCARVEDRVRVDSAVVPFQPQRRDV